MYNDDIAVTGNDREEIAGFKSYLAKELEIKDPVDLRFFLGIEVLGQNMDLLQEVNRPIEANHRLGEITDSEEPIDKEEYQWMVGKFIYLSHTRPDIEYAVRRVSPFMKTPLKPDLEVLFRILRYLKGSSGKGPFVLKE